jgi:NADPH:quinone reductase-like Zn-dependent oxidoreductase
MQAMKAVRIHRYGHADTLCYEDVPLPSYGDDDVLIRVHAASVNRIDPVVREGYMTAWFKHTLPLTLGCDVSGTVAAVGAQVTNVIVGDAVYARTDVERNGSYAEYVAVRAADVAPKPTSIDHVQAAAVPHAALTAWQALLQVAELEPGQTVLLHAAAGGVGHFAVQIAKWRGAHVIGTASGKNLDFLRELGVDTVIDYTTTRFEDVAYDVDVVLDTIGAETQQRSWQTLRRGGMMTSLVDFPSEEIAAGRGVRQRMIGTQANAEQLAQIGNLIDAGHLRPTVSHILPLDQVAEAHSLIEARHTRGKIVLRING